MSATQACTAALCSTVRAWTAPPAWDSAAVLMNAHPRNPSFRHADTNASNMPTRRSRPTADSRPVPGPPLALVAGQDVTLGARRRRWSLPAGALAVPAPWPAAGSTLAFLQLLLGPADAAFSGHLLLGILHPADELVSGQRRDVLPSIECRRVGDQRPAYVCGKLVHHPTGHSLAAHRVTVAVQGPACLTNSAAHADAVVTAVSSGHRSGECSATRYRFLALSPWSRSERQLSF